MCPGTLVRLRSMETGKAYGLTNDRIGNTSESPSLNCGVESWVYCEESRSIGKNQISEQRRPSQLLPTGGPMLPNMVAIEGERLFKNVPSLPSPTVRNCIPWGYYLFKLEMGN